MHDMRRLATHILIYTTTRPFPHISWAADRAKAPDDRNIGPRLPRDSVKKDRVPGRGVEAAAPWQG